MEKSLKVVKSKFPSAAAPLAERVEDVFDTWKELGLEPIEVSEEDITTQISITSEPHTGRIEWDVKKADGLHALSIMATVMKDMFEQYTKGSAKVKLDKNSPDTKAAIMLKDGQIHMAYDQKADPMVTKGLIVACLWKLIENSRTEYHPLDDIIDTLTFDIEE